MPSRYRVAARLPQTKVCRKALSNLSSMSAQHDQNTADPDVERIFHCTENGSYKFWRVRIQGSEQTVCYGRIGTPGQTQTKTFESAEAAHVATEKLIAQKQAKGYIAVTAEANASAIPIPVRRDPGLQLLLPLDDFLPHPLPVNAPVRTPAPPTLSLDF